jgi:UDP-N-acetylmuramoyl-tripeptide--D-alanyl-D-alanine ligase
MYHSFSYNVEKGAVSMKPIQVKEIRQILHGDLLYGSEDWYIENVIYYKRHILDKKNSMLFVSRRDEINWKELEQLGPCLVISDKSAVALQQHSEKITVLRVASVIQAYWKFMTYYRNLFSLPVISITGTCGKTTTKEIIKHVLGEKLVVQASISSMNEPRRSLPYLMGIDETTEAAIFELGLGNTGNITHQCMIYQPTIGIITNIGVHHLDGTGSLEGYIQAKGEIVKGIRENGILILNVDDENTKKISLEGFKGKTIYFGKDSPCDFQATDIRYGNNRMFFNVVFNQISYPLSIPGYGEHQVYNALAALAAIWQVGRLSMEEIARRMASFKPLDRHLEVTTGHNGCMVIDDTWTNNPTSVESALNVVESIAKGKKVIVILGDINRLGDYEVEYHQKIGTLVAGKNIDTLFTIGKKAREIGHQAIRDRFKGKVYLMDNALQLKALLEGIIDQNTLILIKGPMSSRSMVNLANGLKKQQD